MKITPQPNFIERREIMDNANRLGVKPIPKLLLSFTLPAITGMIVNALYNVADRIFVGQGVAEAAIGGLTVAGPPMMVSFAFAMLFGPGAANLISLRLGEKRKEDAQQILNHCFVLLAIAGVIIMGIGLLFTKQILVLFGGQEGSASLEYAIQYYRIVLLGTPFQLIGFGMSHSTRAQGFPKMTMIAMLIGAITNIILDPIFIFAFKWGVEGAAIATVIAQFFSMTFILYFVLSKKAILRLSLKGFKLKLPITGQIMAAGSAQFALNLAASFVSLLYNVNISSAGIAYFGSETGGDSALTAIGIINSFSMLIMMPVFGINQGAQPLLGYNYGAKQFKRVLETLKYAVIAATVLTCLGFVFSVGFPSQVLWLFAPDATSELKTIATIAIRLTFMFFPVIGFQVVFSNYFIVTGKPKISMFLTLSRQLIVLAPCILIFSHFWGLMGIIWAAPVSDLVSTVLTLILSAREIKRLKIQAEGEASQINVQKEKLEHAE